MKPLVFIHGAGCTGAVFDAQREAFPNAVILTLPGHTTPGAPDSIEVLAQWVRDELASRDLHDVVLCGSSMGGAIALEAALAHDPRIAAIVLLGSGATLRVSPAIFEALERDFPAAARMLAGYFFAEPAPILIDAAVAQMLAVGGDQTHRDFVACNAFDVTARLGEIRLPVLALTGERDRMMPPKHAQVIADRVPAAQARILPGAGHLAMVEHPADTNEALRSFVNQIGNSPSA